MASIRLQDVWKRYGAVEAVRGLTLDCPDGSLLALLGPSGCGKTSTLKMIAGLEAASAGEIYFDDRPVTAVDPGRRNVAMVFEDYALYPHLTVFENVAFPLRVRRRPAREIERAVSSVLALLGLEDLRDLSVRALSGGAQQRVAIGRALVREPAVILFDEPLSHLDGTHKVHLRAEIKRLQQETGVTGVLVTHDQTEAMAMADRIAVMEGGELQQIGTPEELYDRPANVFVAQFIGEPPMNLLPGRLSEEAGVVRVEAGGAAVPLPASRAASARASPADGAVIVGVRPERLELGPAGGGGPRGWRGRVLLREFRGDTDVVLVRLDALREVLTAEVAPTASWREGDEVEALPPPDGLHLFDGKDGRCLR
jgi:multiple sugar transport system ATP-binding protein